MNNMLIALNSDGIDSKKKKHGRSIKFFVNKNTLQLKKKSLLDTLSSV